MSILNAKLASTAVGKSAVKDISNWKDVGLTVDGTGATGEGGNVEGSRGMGHVTDVWEVLMAYGDAPKQIDNSIRRLRLDTTSITDGEVVVEAVGNY